ESPRSHTGLLRLREQPLELLLRPRAGGGDDVLIGLRWDVALTGHRDDRVDDVDDHQIGVVRLRHLDRLLEGGRRRGREIRWMDDTTSHETASQAARMAT